MHVLWVVAFEEVRLVAVAAQQIRDLVVGAPAQHRGAGDLVAVQMQDRQHCAVPRRVQKMDSRPRSRQRSRFSLAVANHSNHEQVRIVECRAEGVSEHVAELTTLVNRPRRGHAHVTRHASRRRELPEEPMHAFRVLRDARVDLRIRAFEVDDVGVALDDEPIQVDVDEAEPGRRPPVPEQAWLDVLRPERLAQERIVLQVDLADGQVVGRTPVRVDVLQVHHCLVLLGVISGAAARSAGRSYASRSPMRSTLTSAGG